MKKWLWVGVTALIVLAGCIKKGDLNFNNVQIENWTPDWALPILNSKLSLKEVVKPGDVVTMDADGMYAIHYTGKLYTVKAEDYINIPDQNYSTPSFTLTTPITRTSFTGSISDSMANHYNYTDTNGSSLKHIAFKSGSIAITLNSTYNQNISVAIVFPNITNAAGSPLRLTASITYPATSGTATTSLAGYTADLTNGGTATNYFAYKIVYTLTGTGQPIAASNALSATVSLSALKFKYIDGTLGRYTIPIPYDTIDVELFKNNLHANIYLRNPKLKLFFSNSFGLGASAELTQIYGLTNKGIVINMAIPGINILGASSIGSTAYSNFVIDSTNSTIQNIFNPGPYKIIYEGKVVINPSAGANTFVTDTSTLSISAEAELPAWLKIIDLSIQDTMAMLLPQDTDILKRAEFKMIVNNGMPVYAGIQLYFADTNYNVLDSLVKPNENLIPEAPVDADGRTIGQTTQAITYFTMEHDAYNAIARKTRFAFIRGALKSSGNASIKIRSADNLQMKLGLRFMLNMSQTGF
ncbi:MAG: hypothetical protein EBX41_05975 [Chitinophagia bacterium]|nr:hypothetical protein [Chitinophagia bacterium]